MSRDALTTTTTTTPAEQSHAADHGSAAHAAASAAAGTARWQVRLLGAVEVSDGVQRIDRFPSRAVAALLARVALAPERAHAREELVELLWPGVALDVGRNRLRQALSTLKSLLEPAGVPGAAVLQADRLAVRAVPGALVCDAVTFEGLARAGRRAEAHKLYAGELMPGYYDEWIDAERQRLQAVHEQLAPLQPQGAVATTDATAPAPSAQALPAPATPPLPTYLARLFGADMAAARLRALVLDKRLVTLLGPGGSGKTRLGVEVAQALRAPRLALPVHSVVWPGQGVPDAPGPSPSGGNAFDRIAFVSLVACDEPAQMLDAVGRALQLPPHAGSGGNSGGAADPHDGVAKLVDGLVALLGGQRVLLVLDNFEQLVGHAEAALAALLAQLPALHLLVTSRRALGLDGEVCVQAEPLALPAAQTALAEAAANPAVALFVDRARAARADFHLAERNHAAIVALVRALAGMPLAIELAASRVRSFQPAEMVAMLAAGAARGAGAAGGNGGNDDAGGAHLALLARGGPRSGHDPRHASMAQVIDWSWRLLDAPAQAAMAALTVVPGDAPLAMIAGMLGSGLADAAARVDALVAHSLVRSSRGGDGVDKGAGDADVAGATGMTGMTGSIGATGAIDASSAIGAGGAGSAGDAERARFGLVEPVREFVIAQVSAPVLAQHAQRLRSWLVQWARGLKSATPPALIAPELPAVHAVLVAAASSAPHDALALALALRPYWETDGMPSRIQAALEHALAQLPPASVGAQTGAATNAPTDAPAKALTGAPTGAPTDAAAAAAAAAVAVAVAAAAAAAAANANADATAANASSATASIAPAVALPTAPTATDGKALRADAHELLAYLRFEAGFVTEAIAHADAALAAAPDAARRARAMVRRAWVELASGHGHDQPGPVYDARQAQLEEALALARGCGDREVQARALHQLAALLIHAHQDHTQSEALLAESQALWLALGDRRKAYARLRNRAQCWAHMQRQDEAMACYALCEKAARDDGDWVGQIDSLLSLATLLAKQRQWQAALHANRRSVALCWQRWHRHGLAYSLWNPPRPLARLRRPEPAIRLMGFAATFWAQGFGPLGAADRREVRRVRALVQAQLGAARTQALWQEGAAMDLATAVALALRE